MNHELVQIPVDGELGGHGVEIGLIVGGGGGTLIGVLTGLAIGHSYNYEFPAAGRGDSFENRK